MHSLPMKAFGIGGSGISWLNLLGYKHPPQWKAFTSGEEISRGDFPDDSILDRLPWRDKF